MKEQEQAELNLPEILGIPKKGIIFSDLDGVWFDEDNNFAPPKPEDLSVLTQAREQGYWLVLNSDTGAESLSRFGRELGFDPLVIAENGAIIYLPNVGKEYISPYKQFFDRFRELFSATLEMDRLSPKGLIETTKSGKPYIWEGEATPFLRDKSKPFGIRKKQKAYLINTARECSFGVYTRVTGNDYELLIDDEETKRTETLLNYLLKKAGFDSLMVCKRYPGLGSCLVKDPRQTKAKAVQRIVEQFPPNLNYFMIGDSKNDSMEPLGNKVITCAVGNADPILQEVTLRQKGILAPKELTISQGASYIIQQILERK